MCPMTAQSKIVEIGRSQGDPNPTEFATEEQSGELPDETSSEQYLETDWDDDAGTSRPWGKILLMVALMSALIGWTGFFVWSHLPEIIANPLPTRVSELIVQWSAPTAVIGLIWMLAMRMSSAEAKRFGDVAALLRVESDALQLRMRNVNGEISLARSFLAENAKELEMIGRISAQRLTEAATQLSVALTESDERAKMLQVASNAAVTNLEQLRNHLPVVTSAAKDATNQIGIAGNTAHSQIQAIIAALKSMDEGATRASDALQALDTRISTSTSVLDEKLSTTSDKLSRSVDSAENRLQTMLNALSSGVSEAEQRLIETANELDVRMATSHQKLEGNLGSLGEAIAHLEAVSDAQDSTSKALLARVKESIEECRDELSKFGNEASDNIAKLAFSVSALNERGEELDGRLAGTRAQAEALIHQAGQMRADLESITDETAQKLVSKLDHVNTMFAEVQAAFTSANDQLAATDQGTLSLVGSVTELEQLVSTQRNALESLNASSSEYLTAQHEQVDILSAAIVHTRSALEELSGVANEQLVASLLRVRETTKQAAEASRKIVDEELATVADKLNERNRIAIETAVEDQVKALDVAMRDAFDRNLSLASDVEERIGAQLKLVDEMAANLEQRVSEAHTSFAGIDDENFARRMALLTESLNSAAIDVAKILSNEVTDTAWAAYLKGDRGVFTRRAVRLLDNGEAKIIAAHYDDDAEFREHVNRYIHDFESMMRVLLSTRDGNAIGVTLLSSDVGKLYVALAQAIERLRS